MNSLKLIDSHCHLDFPEFDLDRDQILANCKEFGLWRLIIPATESATWSRLIELSESRSELLFALGLHPLFMKRHRVDDLERLAAIIEQHRPIAVGEIGLDFYSDRADAAAQIELFSAQLILAQKYRLPVLLHVRKAHDEVLKLLRQKNIPGGIVHAYNGSLQQAQQYRDLGFLLGFGGALTYPRANHLRALVTELPLNVLALETDAPDMSPRWSKGQRNSPTNLLKIADEIAALRKESLADVARITTENLVSLLLPH